MNIILTQIQQDNLRDRLWQESYITACEQDSPNSPDFERLRIDIYDYLIDEHCDELY